MASSLPSSVCGIANTDSSEKIDKTGTVNTSGNGSGWVGVIEYQKRFNDFLFGFEAHKMLALVLKALIMKVHPFSLGPTTELPNG